MAFSGDDRLGRVREGGRLLLQRCSGKPLLGDFSVNSGFLYSGSRLGFILRVEESLVELSIYQVGA